MKAPVILFVYARPDHARRTLDALAKNDLASQTPLTIYCDGPKADADLATIERIRETRALVKGVEGFHSVEVVEHDQNVGLDQSVLKGVNAMFERYERLIVLEDDILTSPGFLQYMNDAFDCYEQDEMVMHVSGYLYPVKEAAKLPETFFLSMGGNWGWGTWKRAWKYYNDDIDGILNQLEKNGDLMKRFNIGGDAPMLKQLLNNQADSYYTWDIFWHATLVLKGGLSLFPHRSLTNNIGHDGTGEHLADTNMFWWSEIAENIDVRRISLEVDTLAEEMLASYFHQHRKAQPAPEGWKSKLKSWLGQ